MNFKNYFLLLLLAVFTINVNAQEATPNVPMDANFVETTGEPTYVPSIASRINELIVSEDLTPREAQDKRSLSNTVIIGKDRQTQDDYFVRNRHETEGSVRVMPPLLVFDAYTSGSQPTDPSLAVGPNHVIVVYNTKVVIYDKAGNILAGPFNPNPTFFPNAGCCDLTASYDAAADRWVLSFLGSGAQVSVSDGPDPVNDGWYNYNVAAVNDYQKLSVWSDGYYMTDNTGSSNKVYALERDEMLAGNSAQVMAFSLPGLVTSGFHSIQAVNVSDANMPAAGGVPFIYMQDDAWGGVTTDHIKLWTLDMDWGAGNGTMSAATELPSTPFISVFDGGGWQNFAQPGGTTIDGLQATIMNQAQFRKMGSHNSMLFNFVVDADATSGKLGAVRWYELRQDDDNQPWTVFQEGTYTSPDGKHAWNASLIMNGNGDIGMGYTALAGPTTPNPTDHRVGSYYTGRFAGDAIGTMTVIEEIIGVGTGNIPGNRYGDYSKIDIDPSDDTTFWFIDEYYNSGRKGIVGAFQLGAPQADDIGVTAITAPNSGPLGAAEDITVSIRNFGSNDITNPEVQYILDDGIAEVENYSGTITAGATESYTFAAQGDFSAAGDHTIVAKTNLSGDTNTGNDESTKTVNNGTVYCEPGGDCSFGDGITKFVMGSIDNNPIVCETGYEDFTSMSTQLLQGATTVLTVQTGYTSAGEESTMWIDFNDDGTFSPSEMIFSNESVTPADTDVTINVDIDGSAPLGVHRLRIRCGDTEYLGDLNDPCDEMQYSTTHDYSVNIVEVLGLGDLTISEGEFTVITSPNNQFDITLTTDFDGIASIAIYNVLGQTLAYNNLEKEGDSYVYHLDMSYADAGVYLIKMGDNSSKTYKTAKIIVK